MKCYSSVLLHIFQPLLWTQRSTSLAGKAQGPERQLVKTAMLWVQLLMGSDTGQKSGFDVNHYKARGLTLPFSPATIPEEDRSWKKGGQNLGGSFLVSTQHKLPGSEANDRSPVISHNDIIMTAITAILMNFLCNLSWQPMKCSQREGLLAARI